MCARFEQRSSTTRSHLMRSWHGKLALVSLIGIHTSAYFISLILAFGCNSTVITQREGCRRGHGGASNYSPCHLIIERV